MSKVGFVGLGIMGTPMAGHLLAAGHELYAFDIRPVPAALVEQGARVCGCGREVAEKSDIVITMVPDTPHVAAALFDPNGVAEGLSPGKIVVDMSSISPVETKTFARRINELGCAYLDAPVSGGEVGAKAASLDDHGRRPGRRVREGEAALREDGQEHHARGRQRRRPDLQGGQPDHRRAEHRGGRRGAAVRVEDGRRPGEGAAGADGRLRLVARARGARRADGQADLRSRLPHRTAPEGPEPRAVERARRRHVAAQHGDRAGTLQRVRRARRQGAGTTRRWSARSRCWRITKWRRAADGEPSHTPPNASAAALLPARPEPPTSPGSAGSARPRGARTTRSSACA